MFSALSRMSMTRSLRPSTSSSSSYAVKRRPEFSLRRSSSKVSLLSAATLERDVVVGCLDLIVRGRLQLLALVGGAGDVDAGDRDVVELLLVPVVVVSRALVVRTLQSHDVALGHLDVGV